MNLLGLTDCRNQTKKDILKLLETNNRVGCVRWTGFGKSYMINELYHELPGEKLILTTRAILQRDFIQQKCQCITYNKLHRNINNNKFLNQFSNIDYIFLDECHRVSTNLWGQSLEIFLNKLNCKVIGFTATPDRSSDLVNVIDYWFKGVQVKPITLYDAYKSDYINPIKYIKSYFNIDQINEDLNLIKSSKEGDFSSLEINNVYGIKEIINKHYNINNGNRVIIFCSRVSDLNDIEFYFLNIFRELFPDKIIKSYKLSYKDIYNINFDKFLNKDNDKNSINLILSIDKLNEGIHLEDANTVIFMRPTYSEIVYLQQIGRSINGTESIIFDFSNNCDRIKIKPGRDGKLYREAGTHSSIRDNKKDKLLDIVEVFDYTIEVNYIFKRIKRLRGSGLDQNKKKYIKENVNKKSIANISDDLDICTTLVYNFLKEENIPFEGQFKGPITKEESIIIKDEIFKGTSINKIAEKLGRYHKIVADYCSENNINYKAKRTKITNDHIFFIREHKRKKWNWSNEKIAKKLGISIHTVKKYTAEIKQGKYKTIKR